MTGQLTVLSHPSIVRHHQRLRTCKDLAPAQQTKNGLQLARDNGSANVRDSSIATEMACPRRVRFYPDSGLNDETRTRPVEACWRFAAVFYATSYPAETP